MLLQYQLLRVVFAFSFNNNYWNCIALYLHASNIAKHSKHELVLILDAELILLQQVLLQYLHLFLVCECGYANHVCPVDSWIEMTHSCNTSSIGACVRSSYTISVVCLLNTVCSGQQNDKHLCFSLHALYIRYHVN